MVFLVASECLHVLTPVRGNFVEFIDTINNSSCEMAVAELGEFEIEHGEF